METITTSKKVAITAVSAEASTETEPNVITTLAEQLRKGDNSGLQSFVDRQFAQLSLLQQKPHSKPVDEQAHAAYTVAHSLFEMMVTESSMVKAILEALEEWNYENLEDAKVAPEDLKEHVKDVFTVAEAVLLRSY